MRSAAIVFLGLAVATASAALKKPCVCTMEYMPVCGSDGVTYPNSCTFRCAAAADSDLKVVAEGECSHPFENEVACICTLEYMPLCGSDGVTYPNLCNFKCKQRANDDLTIVSHGECKASLKMSRPVCKCTREYNPMCGSDGKTYANPCLLECQKKVEGSLALLHAGVCQSKSIAPVCVCSREYDPVCGSDGRTYNNPCLLRCQQKVDNSLTATRHGRCEEMKPEVRIIPQHNCPCTSEYNPVCGSDGETYDNPCLFRCQQRYQPGLEMARFGRCKTIPMAEMGRSAAPAPMCICTREYNPFCGSNGVTYNNECLLKCAQRGQPGLTAVRQGRCEDGESLAPVCACSREYEPMCGSDGRTYNNPCLLRCQQKVDNSLTAVRHGRCEDARAEVRKIPSYMCPCTREYNPVCGNDGETYDNPCLLKCQQRYQPGLDMARFGRCKTIPMAEMGRSAAPAPMCLCTREYNPFCGSDGVTYNNECLLKCAQRGQPGLTAVRQGRCEDKQTEAPLCACNRMLWPVCGSDGKTYANPCLLKCEQRINSGLTQLHEGKCDSAVQLKSELACPCPLIFKPVCGTDGVTYDNECILNCKVKGGNSDLKLFHQGACFMPFAKAGGPCVCNKMYIPVCGSDGVTYNNPCLIGCRQQEDSDIKIVHYGRCQEVTEQPKSEGVCACPFILMPVCGTDGVTYDNECILNCKAKNENSDLKVWRRGTCEIPVVAKAGFVCACPRIYMPVCGTDGVTYDNECILNCKVKEGNSGLKVFHHGFCAVPIAAKSEVVCACPFIYKPVCGTDGVTYSNECILNCKVKNGNAGLKVFHEGFCAVPVVAKSKKVCPCALIYKPVCGTDGITYPNQCSLDCKVKNGNDGLKVLHEGLCKPQIASENDVCVCTDDYRPVCGSDMKTYANKCEFNCAQRKQNALSISHEGECQQVTDFEDVCVCNRMYLPVCGTDGVTYDNPCVLGCAQRHNPGLQLLHDSEC